LQLAYIINYDLDELWEKLNVIINEKFYGDLIEHFALEDSINILNVVSSDKDAESEEES
jgi:hypothetical protein